MVTTKKDKHMSKQVEFFFDFGSPAAYLVVPEKVASIAAKAHAGSVST